MEFRDTNAASQRNYHRNARDKNCILKEAKHNNAAMNAPQKNAQTLHRTDAMVKKTEVSCVERHHNTTHNNDIACYSDMVEHKRGEPSLVSGDNR